MDGVNDADEVQGSFPAFGKIINRAVSQYAALPEFGMFSAVVPATSITFPESHQYGTTCLSVWALHRLQEAVLLVPLFLIIRLVIYLTSYFHTCIPKKVTAPVITSVTWSAAVVQILLRRFHRDESCLLSHLHFTKKGGN